MNEPSQNEMDERIASLVGLKDVSLEEIEIHGDFTTIPTQTKSPSSCEVAKQAAENHNCEALTDEFSLHQNVVYNKRSSNYSKHVAFYVISGNKDTESRDDEDEEVLQTIHNVTQTNYDEKLDKTTVFHSQMSHQSQTEPFNTNNSGTFKDTSVEFHAEVSEDCQTEPLNCTKECQYSLSNYGMYRHTSKTSGISQDCQTEPISSAKDCQYSFSNFEIAENSKASPGTSKQTSRPVQTDKVQLLKDGFHFIASKSDTFETDSLFYSDFSEYSQTMPHYQCYNKFPVYEKVSNMEVILKKSLFDSAETFQEHSGMLQIESELLIHTESYNLHNTLLESYGLQEGYLRSHHFLKLCVTKHEVVFQVKMNKIVYCNDETRDCVGRFRIVWDNFNGYFSKAQSLVVKNVEAGREQQVEAVKNVFWVLHGAAKGCTMPTGPKGEFHCPYCYQFYKKSPGQSSCGDDSFYMQGYSIPPCENQSFVRSEKRKVVNYTEAQNDDYHYFNGFSNLIVRNDFVCRVYLVLFVQLLIVIGIVCLCYLLPGFATFLAHNVKAMSITFSTLYLVMVLGLLLFEASRKWFPVNFIVYLLVTICIGFVLGSLSAYFGTALILFSLVLVNCVNLFVCLFSSQKMIETAECGMYICIVGIVAILFAVVAIVSGLWWQISIFALIYGAVISLIVCVYVLYDVQQILMGRRIRLEPKQYLCGAVSVNVDMFYFLVVWCRYFGVNV